MFKDRYHPAVKKDLRKIDKAVREKIKKVWIPKLLLEPDEGKELTGSLSGICSYHFKAGKVQYRVAYVLKKKDIGLLINFGPSGVEVKRKYRKPKTECV